MINKKILLTIAAIACLTFIPADASSLVQMDIKKSSDSSVDVTFYTTSTNGNPIVTRKSTNKYVVLMPNVASGSISSPDLSSVKDMISDVNIKNVDDGMSGYTKITFITTKPVNIITHTQKAVPLTQEEKEAKAVIAQVKTQPKAEPKKEPSKNVTIKNPSPSVVNKISEKAPKVISEKEAKKVEPEKKAPAPQKVFEPVKSAENVKPVQTPAEVAPSVPLKVEQAGKFDIKEVEKIEKIAKSKAQKFSDKHKNNANAGWTLVILPLLALYMLARMIRNSIQKSDALKKSFAENLAEKPLKSANYDDIINNTELNWQERYQKFVQESDSKIKNRQYNFIKTEKIVTDIDKKRLELEQTLEKTPEIYKPLIVEPVEPVKVSEVKSEDDAIQEQLKEIKLTAFAKPVSLHTSQRRRLKKILPEEKHFTEGKFVKFEKSPLNTTYREFTTGNLNVSDLVKTGSRYIPEPQREEKLIDEEQNYIMSSIDEYFALLDKEQARKMTNPNNDLSRKVAESLAQVKPSMKLRRNKTTFVNTNPIESKSSNETYLNGLVVKAGYNIDEERGFYLVSLDGVTALVGRVKDEIFVLKKFDENVDKLQVRLDNENVYMVKAGDFKSLVDVDENKMGVLIEL